MSWWVVVVRNGSPMPIGPYSTDTGAEKKAESFTEGAFVFQSFAQSAEGVAVEFSKAKKEKYG